MPRKRTPYEDKHLKNPYFLEKYFQKKPIWLIMMTLLTPIIVWALSLAILDLLNIKDEPDFNLFSDLFIIIGSPVMAYLVIDEFRFYQKEIWGKKSKK